MRRGPRTVGAAFGTFAVALQLAGLAVIAVGLAKAVPVVFSGGDAELSAVAEGERILPLGAGLLAGSFSFLLLRRAYVASVVALVTGVVPVVMVLSDTIPATNGEFVFFLLAPVSLAISSAGAIQRPRRRWAVDLACRAGAPRGVALAAWAVTWVVASGAVVTAYGMVAGPVGGVFGVLALGLFAGTWRLCVDLKTTPAEVEGT